MLLAKSVGSVWPLGRGFHEGQDTWVHQQAGYTTATDYSPRSDVRFTRACGRSPYTPCWTSCLSRFAFPCFLPTTNWFSGGQLSFTGMADKLQRW